MHGVLGRVRGPIQKRTRRAQVASSLDKRAGLAALAIALAARHPGLPVSGKAPPRLTCRPDNALGASAAGRSAVHENYVQAGSGFVANFDYVRVYELKD